MSVLATARTYKRHLLSHEAHAAARLTAAYHLIWAGILPHVTALQTALQQALDDGKPVTASSVMRLTQMHNLLSATESGMAHWSQLARAQVEASRTYAATLGSTSAQALLQATVPHGISYTFGTPSPDAIAHLSGVIAPSSPLGKVFRGWGADAAKAARSTLLTGLTRGQGPRQVARDLADAAQIPLQRALVISRNEMVSSYRGASLANYRANSDVVSQWRWVSDKGLRTCGLCLAMDGTLHDLDEDMVSHVSCRCAAIPVTRSWGDILGDLGADIHETSDAASHYQSGASWFDGLNAAQQDRVLGRAKGAAYRAGDLTLDDLVGTQHDRQWGPSLRERSMSDLGLSAADYR